MHLLKHLLMRARSPREHHTLSPCINTLRMDTPVCRALFILPWNVCNFNVSDRMKHETGQGVSLPFALQEHLQIDAAERSAGRCNVCVIESQLLDVFSPILMKLKSTLLFINWAARISMESKRNCSISNSLGWNTGDSFEAEGCCSDVVNFGK